MPPWLALFSWHVTDRKQAKGVSRQSYMNQDVAVELTQISHRFKSEAELQHGRQCSSTSIGAVIITVIFREARGASCDNTAEDGASSTAPQLPHPSTRYSCRDNFSKTTNAQIACEATTNTSSQDYEAWTLRWTKICHGQLMVYIGIFESREETQTLAW